MRWEFNATPRPLYPRERDPVPNVQEAGWAPGSVWTGLKNLTSTGINPRTVQPVTSHCTDYAIPDHQFQKFPRELKVLE
jgi:hypothetical protein